MLTWTTSLDGNPGAKTLPHPKNIIHKVPKNSPKSSLVKMEKSPGLGNPKDYTKKLRDDDICSEVGCILYRMKT